MKCGWSESMAFAASISSAWTIEYPPMNVFGLELPAFVTFISFPVGVPISTSACVCASNHLTHGSIPFCMSSGLAVCICCSADTGDKYNNKNLFIVRASPLLLFSVPANSNNDTIDHKNATWCIISLASPPFSCPGKNVPTFVSKHIVTEGSMREYCFMVPGKKIHHSKDFLTVKEQLTTFLQTLTEISSHSADCDSLLIQNFTICPLHGNVERVRFALSIRC